MAREDEASLTLQRTHPPDTLLVFSGLCIHTCSQLSWGFCLPPPLSMQTPEGRHRPAYHSIPSSLNMAGNSRLSVHVCWHCPDTAWPWGYWALNHGHPGEWPAQCQNELLVTARRSVFTYALFIFWWDLLNFTLVKFCFSYMLLRAKSELPHLKWV